MLCPEQDEDIQQFAKAAMGPETQKPVVGKGQHQEHAAAKDSAGPVAKEKPSLADQKTQLEIDKLNEEITTIRNSRRWRWNSLGAVKITEWITAGAAVILVCSGWYSGFFSAARERLETDKNRLAIEQQHSEQKLVASQKRSEELSEQIVTKEKELTLVQGKLRPFEAEEAALLRFGKLGEKGIRVSVTGELVGEAGHEGVWVTIHPLMMKNEELKTAAFQKLRRPDVSDAITSANQLRKLRRLRMWGLALTSNEFASLTSRNDLTWLVLHGMELDRDDLRAFQSISSLTTLKLKYNKIDSLKTLPIYNQLSVLDLNGNPLSDEGLESISRVAPNIESLDLTSTKLTDNGMRHLLKLNRLRSVSLFNTQVTSNGLLVLAESPSIRVVSIDKKSEIENAAELVRKKNADFHISHWSPPITWDFSRELEW